MRAKDIIVGQEYGYGTPSTPLHRLRKCVVLMVRRGRSNIMLFRKDGSDYSFGVRNADVRCPWPECEEARAEYDAMIAKSNEAQAQRDREREAVKDRLSALGLSRESWDYSFMSLDFLRLLSLAEVGHDEAIKHASIVAQDVGR